MKKLSILAALALVTTVGGVYATWNYAEGTATNAEKDVTIDITLADTKTQSGTIKIHNTLALTIDDEGVNLGKDQYTPGWDDYVTNTNGGTLDLEFEANAGSNLVTLEYTLTISGNAHTDTETNTAVPIFVYDAVAGEAADVVAKGTFVCEASATEAHKIWTYQDFTQMLRVNDAFTVDTYAEYEKYAEAVKGVKITVSVVEVTA
ncbi:MAG: hypothetical protein IJX87_02775 [Clostridia bacterium]|nr:hypothetical protein [Clostridia bacterium]